MPLITRRQHPLIRSVLDLRDQPDSRFIFVEGPRLLQEVLQSATSIQTLIERQADAPPMDAAVLGRLRKAAKGVFTVNHSVFRVISDVAEPQGIAAICERPAWTWEDLLKWGKTAPIVILDGLQNPANAAAILRTAEAAGAAGILTTPGTAHLFSPKALRAAMGSSFRLPSLEHQSVKTIMEKLNGCRLLGASMEGAGGSVVFTEADWTPPVALVLGQEAGGLQAAWKPHLTQTLRIPMKPPVESLNVSAAAALLLYEFQRKIQP